MSPPCILHPQRRQSGAAILVAMLVVAMAAMAATGFVFRTSLEWRKYDNARAVAQARWVVRAAEHWAAALLRDDGRRSSADHRDELWAKELPPVDTEGYTVSGRVEDLDGRFNINNLINAGQVDEAQLTLFSRLLQLLEMPPELADAVADWLDADDERRLGQGSERESYLTRVPANVPGNRPVLVLAELAPVAGMTEDFLQRLEGHVTALPTRTRINVNTASAEVITALVSGLSLEEAYTLVALRDKSHFRNLTDFEQALAPGLSAMADMASVSSDYFLVRARARHERIQVGSRALLHREPERSPVIVWRTTL